MSPKCSKRCKQAHSQTGRQAGRQSEAGTVGKLGMRYAHLEMETEHERQRLHRQLSEETQHNTEVTLWTNKID